MNTIDVTVIVTAHQEGILAKSTISSLAVSVKEAHQQAISTEVLVIMDSADKDTWECFQRNCPANWKIYSINVKDLGVARMHGVALAQGKYCCFLDSDDMFGPNWISEAFRCAEGEQRSVAWHPELNIIFGHIEPYGIYHADMDDPDWDDANIIFYNPWSALVFVSKEILLKYPYPETDFSKQIGYEDWGWNQKVIANGVIHKRVPNTAHFIRVKRSNSLVKHTQAYNSIPAITSLITAPKPSL